MRVRSTNVLGARLVLLTIVTAMALIVDTPPKSAALPGGAGQVPDPGVEAPAAGSTPLDRHGMWVWYMDRIEGGDLGRIISRAKQNGIGTLYVKSGDATDYWSQFNTAMVQRLHRAGLSVCAWQFVYGDAPLGEARTAAAAVKRGADCFVIDAEGQYEGKYAAADRYVRALRSRIGAEYPVALASFPYVDYHPSFPYSVFFGPGGATYNQPQMYWKTIETSVRAVYEHTYLYNRLWDHPIYPLGQTYQQPGRKAIVRFRRFADSYGGRAPSWWAWHETTATGWGALATESGGPIPAYEPVTANPVLKKGSKGDLVVWAQMHLRGAGQTQLPVTGIFGRMTRAAVRSFQIDHGLFADGVVGDTTWEALLNFDPARPLWAGRRAKRGRGAAASRAMPPRRPLSASLPAMAYEIAPGPAP